MLVINYNGNKPTSDCFKYSVQGNNNADVVCFSLPIKQSTIDLNPSDYKVYVKCKCDEDDFVDKVEITNDVSIVNNQLICLWTLLKKHTINRQLLVSLCFESEEGEIVFQTQLIKLTIANGIDVDEEIINSYPTIIQQMQDDIEELQEQSGGTKLYKHTLFFLKGTSSYTIKFVSSSSTALTLENIKSSYSDTFINDFVKTIISTELADIGGVISAIVINSQNADVKYLNIDGYSLVDGTRSTILGYNNQPTGNFSDTIIEL